LEQRIFVVWVLSYAVLRRDERGALDREDGSDALSRGEEGLFRWRERGRICREERGNVS
jgi:hypothetical protein